MNSQSVHFFFSHGSLLKGTKGPLLAKRGYNNSDFGKKLQKADKLDTTELLKYKQKRTTKGFLFDLQRRTP